MKSTLTLQEDIILRNGQIAGYVVRGLPDGQEAHIRDFGAPTHAKWQIRLVGVDENWTGNYPSAEDALAELQSRL